MDLDRHGASALLRGLNPEQSAAVTLGRQHALVLAGAGSGKTRVLTTRMAWLMQTGQVGPGGLMAVTFTNKAAKEMLTRLQALLPVNVRGMWVGTFHGLCNRLLRAHWKAAALPQAFQILDTQDQLSAVKRLCKQFAVDDERYPPKALTWFFAACKEDGLRPADVPVRDEDTRKKVELYQLYEDQCQREGVVDFAELLLRSFELLRDHADIREHYQRRFRHLLVDEFQDTNKLQYAWLKQLVGPETAVLAVGDDDQSIYAFRGARVGNMTDFVREFQVGTPIKLEQNYRSHSHILDAANHLIDHNSQRLGKNLRTDRGAGEPVRVFESPTDFDEARWVVDEVRQLIRGGGAAALGETAPDAVPRHEIALLYRSNAQSRVLETALFNAGVPYKVYGGLRFFERAEIKHALAYLRLLDNPRDDTSFLRVVNMPPRGIGARSIEQLQDLARASGCALFDAVTALPGRAGTVMAGFVAKLDVMREHTQGRTLREIVRTVLDQSGLLAHFQADKDGADRVENLEELVNAAESFVSNEGFGRDAVALPLDETAASATALRDRRPGPVLTQSPASQGLWMPPPDDPHALDLANARAAQAGQGGAADPQGHDDALADWADLPFEALSATQPPARRAVDAPEPLFSGPEPDTGETLSPLAAFLTHAALEAGDNQAQAGQDAVQLMTVHAAKGLEFDCVFITGLEEGLFPHENAASDRAGLEEERRLMYVAITRARQRLYLSHSQTRMLHGQTRYNARSRFLDELPEACLRWLTPRSGGFGALPSRAAWGMGAHQSVAENPYSSSAGSHFYSKNVGFKPSVALAPDAARQASAAGLAHPPGPTTGAPAVCTGQSVFHNKFGEGLVLAVEGVGADARAQIRFNRHGIKWLALSVAKLTVVDA